MQPATIQLKAPRRPARPLERPVTVPAVRQPNSWLGRWLGRREPTTFHRCLAIHIHFAGPHSALS
jgi:hypothetical protein